MEKAIIKSWLAREMASDDRVALGAPLENIVMIEEA